MTRVRARETVGIDMKADTYGRFSLACGAQKCMKVLPADRERVICVDVCVKTRGQIAVARWICISALWITLSANFYTCVDKTTNQTAIDRHSVNMFLQSMGCMCGETSTSVQGLLCSSTVSCGP